MIRKSIENIKLPQLSGTAFKDRLFRLIWIQGINTKPLDNHYKVLFREVIKPKSVSAKASCLIEKIFPEFLQYYKIGCHYRDSKYIRTIPPVGEELSISVESTENNIFVEASKVLTDNEYRLSQHVSHEEEEIDYSLENKSQYCVVFENNERIVIFPCAVIGSAYYFSSSSMRKQILAQNLKGLYESIELSDNGEARILLKTVAKEDDAPHIVRFASNKFAHSRWNAIKNDLYAAFTKLCFSGSMSGYVPLKIDFPVKQLLNMKIRGFKFNDMKRKKDKILVFEILSEDSPFGFRSLMIISKGRKKVISPESRLQHSKALKTTNRLINVKSSSGLSEVAIRLRGGIINNNIKKLIISKEYMSDEEHGDIRSLTYTDDVADISVIPPDTLTHKKIRKGSVERMSSKEGEATKEDFSPDDFYKMVDFLREFERVVDLRISGKLQMPWRYENASVCSIRESYDRTVQNRRRFVFVTFGYKGCSICLIEVDHSRFPNSPATYVLVAPGQDKLTQPEVEFVLALYVRYTKLGNIAEELRERGINFLPKKHPVKKDEKHFRIWSKELLARLDVITGNRTVFDGN